MSKRVVTSFEELGRAQANKREQRTIDSSKVIKDFSTEPVIERDVSPWVKKRRAVRAIVDQAIEQFIPESKPKHEPTFEELFMRKQETDS